MAKPFLKWAGGKRKSFPIISSWMPEKFETYYEPFIGGGAVFFALQEQNRSKNAVLNDINSELMITYGALKYNLDAVIQTLKTYPYEEAFFYKMRAEHPIEIAKTAARMIYLNHTCFNGLYRVNSKGLFNAPFGDYAKPCICDEANLKAVNKALGKATFTCIPIEYYALMSYPTEDDVVYLDPPYLPISKTSNFTSYSKGGFSFEDHKKLSNYFTQLASRGVPVLLSNSNLPEIRELYKGFQIETIQCSRSINTNGEKRGKVSEILVVANCTKRIG